MFHSHGQFGFEEQGNYSTGGAVPLIIEGPGDVQELGLFSVRHTWLWQQGNSATYSHSLPWSFLQCERHRGKMRSPFSSCHCTMRFGSTAKVLLKCKLKYYRISECTVHRMHTGM